MFHFLLPFLVSLCLCSAQYSISSSPIRVVVPVKKGFEQFVSFDTDTHAVNGFAVQVFQSALHHQFPTNTPNYTFVLFYNSTNPNHTPSYNAMVQMVHDGKADAVVADLTITRKRMDQVDFTVPYIESGLVMVTKFRYGAKGTFWDFLRPFSMELWIALLLSFLVTGFVLLLLENKNPEFSWHTTTPSLPPSFASDGPPVYSQASYYRRVMNALWFASLCVFMAQQSSVRTYMGRVVTVAWLFTMLIFNSSYTANLATMLSSNEQFPMYHNLQKLRTNTNAYVGYQDGSFVYQTLQDMGFTKNRLRGYSSAPDFAKALHLGSNLGGVDAIIDEAPYMQILVQSDCELMIVGDELNSLGGFGFAFNKNSSLTEEISKGILSLAENGFLKSLRQNWIGNDNDDECSQTKSQGHLRLASFGGLFIIVGVAYGLTISWRFLNWLYEHFNIPTTFALSREQSRVHGNDTRMETDNELNESTSTKNVELHGVPTQQLENTNEMHS